MSASLRKRTKGRTFRYVRLVPCVDGSELAREIFTSHCWSAQPCVRPVSAARRAANHSASADQVPFKSPHLTVQPFGCWTDRHLAVSITSTFDGGVRRCRPARVEVFVLSLASRRLAMGTAEICRECRPE